MSLATPEKIRTLQRKLYRKAKAEPAFRFYVLYDKICREDILAPCLCVGPRKCGRAGGGRGDLRGRSRRRVWRQWLAGLREDLVSKTYRPDPVRRVMIPKPGGGRAPARHPDGPRIKHLMQFVLGMKDEDDLSLRPTYGGVGHHRH